MRPSMLGTAGLMIYLGYAGLPGPTTDEVSAILYRDVPAAVTCPHDQLCLDRQAKFTGKPITDTGVRGTAAEKCIRLTSGSPVHDGVPETHTRHRDGSLRSNRVVLHTEDIPKCNDRPPHRSGPAPAGKVRPVELGSR